MFRGSMVCCVFLLRVHEASFEGDYFGPYITFRIDGVRVCVQTVAWQLSLGNIIQRKPNKSIIQGASIITNTVVGVPYYT